MFGHNDRGIATDRGEPFTEFLGIGHGGRQPNDGYVVRQVQDDFFPDRAAGGICKEVDFIHDHVSKSIQRGRIRVDHIAQHLGGHHHDFGIGVNGDIASKQTDGILTVLSDEVVVFLVAQRLNRGGIKALRAAA